MKINQEIINNAVNHFGTVNQKIKAVEELSELSVAITQEINKPVKKIDCIITEIADVYIMLKQLLVVYDIPESFVQEEINFKLIRLNEVIRSKK